MKTFLQWLEMSYTQSDVPEYFYLACKLNQELLSGELNHLEGITSSAYIAAAFWHQYKQCLLQMPGKRLTEINKLTRVMYHNPGYMISNKFNAMNRVNPQGAMNPPVNITDFLTRVHGMHHNKAQSISLKTPYPRIYANNVGDYVRQLYTFLQSKGVDIQPNNATMQYFNQNLGNAAQFAHEEEWMVKPEYKRIEKEIEKLPILRIPEGTICVVNPEIDRKMPEPPEQRIGWFNFKQDKKSHVTQRMLAKLSTRMHVYMADRVPDQISQSYAQGQSYAQELFQRARAGELQEVLPELV
jgi:hypothetical protein